MATKFDIVLLGLGINWYSIYRQISAKNYQYWLFAIQGQIYWVTKRGRMLSKSKIVSGLQCPTKLWLGTHAKSLGEVSVQQQLVMQRGEEFGVIARKQYPGGYLINVLDAQGRVDVKGALAQTQQLLEQFKQGKERVPLYEATFERDNTIVMIDILLPAEGEGWKIIEVKSGKAKDGENWNERYITDAAIQTYVASASITIDSTYLGYPNTEFCYAKYKNYDGILKVEEVSDLIVSHLLSMPAIIEQMKRVVQSSEPVPAKITSNCKGCEFLAHCSGAKLGPSESIRVPVWYLGSSPEVAIVQNLMHGHRDLASVPVGKLSKPIHQQMRKIAQSGDYYIDSHLVKYLENQPWPRYFLDYEYLGKPVPLWLQTKVNEQVPFQFSLHKWSGPNDIVMKHVEYIADSLSDPRQEFIQNLIAAFDEDGPIYTWHGNSVEGPITRKLCDFATAEQCVVLERIAQRCKQDDLLKLFQQYFYALGMHGWSVKEVARCLLSNNPYGSLETANGVEAMAGYEEFLNMKPSPERVKLKEDLLAYCKADTGVMVDIWKAVLKLGVQVNN